VSGLIVDRRNYPSEFVAFELGQRVVCETTPFALYAYRDLGNPGYFRWTPNTSVLVPTGPIFDGEALVDEITQNQAGPNTVVVGSTTAATNGDFAYIPIPSSKAHSLCSPSLAGGLYSASRWTDDRMVAN